MPRFKLSAFPGIAQAAGKFDLTKPHPPLAPAFSPPQTLQKPPGVGPLSAVPKLPAPPQPPTQPAAAKAPPEAPQQAGELKPHLRTPVPANKPPIINVKPPQFQGNWNAAVKDDSARHMFSQQMQSGIPEEATDDDIRQWATTMTPHQRMFAGIASPNNRTRSLIYSTIPGEDAKSLDINDLGNVADNLAMADDRNLSNYGRQLRQQLAIPRQLDAFHQRQKFENTFEHGVEGLNDLANRYSELTGELALATPRTSNVPVGAVFGSRYREDVQKELDALKAKIDPLREEADKRRVAASLNVPTPAPHIEIPTLDENGNVTYQRISPTTVGQFGPQSEGFNRWWEKNVDPINKMGEPTIQLPPELGGMAIPRPANGSPQEAYLKMLARTTGWRGSEGEGRVIPTESPFEMAIGVGGLIRGALNGARTLAGRAIPQVAKAAPSAAAEAPILLKQAPKAVDDVIPLSRAPGTSPVIGAKPTSIPPLSQGPPVTLTPAPPLSSAAKPPITLTKAPGVVQRTVTPAHPLATPPTALPDVGRGALRGATKSQPGFFSRLTSKAQPYYEVNPINLAHNYGSRKVLDGAENLLTRGLTSVGVPAPQTIGQGLMLLPRAAAWGSKELANIATQAGLFGNLAKIPQAWAKGRVGGMPLLQAGIYPGAAYGAVAASQGLAPEKSQDSPVFDLTNVQSGDPIARHLNAFVPAIGAARQEVDNAVQGKTLDAIQQRADALKTVGEIAVNNAKKVVDPVKNFGEQTVASVNSGETFGQLKTLNDKYLEEYAALSVLEKQQKQLVGQLTTTTDPAQFEQLRTQYEGLTKQISAKTDSARAIQQQAASLEGFSGPGVTSETAALDAAKARLATQEALRGQLRLNGVNREPTEAEVDRVAARSILPSVALDPSGKPLPLDPVAGGTQNVLWTKLQSERATKAAELWKSDPKFQAEFKSHVDAATANLPPEFHSTPRGALHDVAGAGLTLGAATQMSNLKPEDVPTLATKVESDPQLQAAGKGKLADDIKKANPTAPPEEVTQKVESVWNNLGVAGKALLIGGLSLTVISLLANLFGDDEDEDGEGAGGSSMLMKILPLLGIGMAAAGASWQDGKDYPDLSVLGDGAFWRGAGNDISNAYGAVENKVRNILPKGP